MSAENRRVTPRPIDAVRLDGGRLCLDFVNSIHNRYAVEVEDYLHQPESFLDWCVRAGALQPDERVSVPRSRVKRSALMREVEILRDHLHELFVAKINDAPLPSAAIRGLDGWLHRAWAGQIFGSDGQLHWRADARDTRLPLKRIALDALQLFGDPSISKLRRCNNTTSCGWLFLDTSKNQRRRWCAMATCGTADKMQRYRKG